MIGPLIPFSQGIKRTVLVRGVSELGVLKEPGLLNIAATKSAQADAAILGREPFMPLTQMAL